MIARMVRRISGAAASSAFSADAPGPTVGPVAFTRRPLLPGDSYLPPPPTLAGPGRGRQENVMPEADRPDDGRVTSTGATVRLPRHRSRLSPPRGRTGRAEPISALSVQPD